METKIKLFCIAFFAIISHVSVVQAQQSVPTTPEEKRAAILTPEYYTKWLGASFFTIATIEKELDVTPVQIIDLTFFYDLGSCFVGMKAIENGVIIQMTLRLFGDTANEFVQKAIEYGYEKVGKGKNVNVHTNTGRLLPEIYGSDVIQYRKATNNGKVWIDIANSQRYANQYEIAIYRTK